MFSLRSLRLRDAGEHRHQAGHARDRRRRGDRARGHVGHARGGHRRRQMPKLCATDTLKAFGSCRLCLVEIEGRKGYPASCTTAVAPGMKVKTQSEKLTRLRRGVIELYVSDHPLECDTCPATGGTASCRTWRGESAARRTAMPRWRAPLGRGRRRQQPVFRLRSRAVHRLLALRARVRRSAGHFRADDRGPRVRLAGRRRARTNRFMDSECVSCGACVEACPTGALTRSRSIAGHRPTRR